MFQDMTEDQLPGAIEALLFVTDEPVSTLTLSEMLEAPVTEVIRVLDELSERFGCENRGIQLREVAGGWRLFTHPAYHDLIERYIISWDTRKLSQAAMETLAIAAYLQPITRAGIASVRGVNSDSSINSLVEKGLLREAGVADTPGNPVLYATTRAFLEKFGLRSPADLPNLDDFAPDDETRDLIRQRLSASSDVQRQVAEGVAAVTGAAADSVGAVNAANDKDHHDSEGFDQALSNQEPSQAAQDALAGAMAQAFGLVEKIDFDSLTFEMDDE